MKYRTLVSILAIATAPVVAQASTLTNSFSSFWILGDGLSDNGNTATMIGGIIAQQPGPIPLPPPNPLQQSGISSDGFTWAKEFTDAFSTVFVGGNDLLDATFDVAQSLAADPFSNPDVVDETLISVKSQIDRLVLEGTDDFIVMNRPDFSAIPQFNGAALSLAATRYNTQLEGYLDLLRDDGIDVTTVNNLTSLTDSQKLDEFGLGTPLGCGNHSRTVEQNVSATSGSLTCVSLDAHHGAKRNTTLASPKNRTVSR